jgi:hypothetical protein
MDNLVSPKSPEPLPAAARQFDREFLWLLTTQIAGDSVALWLCGQTTLKNITQFFHAECSG